MLQQSLIAAEYPFLDGVIYMDGGQFGIPPMRTRLAGQRFLDEYINAVLEDGDAGFVGIRSKARGLLAELVGGSAEEIIFTKNTTEGVAILAMGYPLGPGDNVVTCDLEHASNLHPWLNASRKRGFELRIAKTQNGEADASGMIALMDEHTKAVAVSAVQSGTGYRTDLPALAEACHKRGAILAVDAIQAIGRLQLQVRELGIDYLACGGYKGLMAGFGVGFAWCARELIDRIEPAYAGAFSMNTFAVPPEIVEDTEKITLRSDSGRLEAGTYNAYGISMMASSVSLLLELGMEQIDSHVRLLERRLREHLRESGLDVITFPDCARQGGMVAACYPKEFYGQVERALHDRHIRLTHRPGYLRIVPGFYNTLEQADEVADVLAGLKYKG